MSSFSDFHESFQMLINIFINSPLRRNSRMPRTRLTTTRERRSRSRSPHPVREADDAVIVIEDSFVAPTSPPVSSSSDQHNIEEAVTGDDDLLIIKPVVPVIDLTKLPETPEKPKIKANENQRRLPESQNSNDDAFYRCPICLDKPNSNRPMSTICGHIFCRKCIETAIKESKKCPICKRALKMTSIHPIFF